MLYNTLDRQLADGGMQLSEIVYYFRRGSGEEYLDREMSPSVCFGYFGQVNAESLSDQKIKASPDVGLMSYASSSRKAFGELGARNGESHQRRG